MRFRELHLQILRSLYDRHGGCHRRGDDDGGERPSINDDGGLAPPSSVGTTGDDDDCGSNIGGKRVSGKRESGAMEGCDNVEENRGDLDAAAGGMDDRSGGNDAVDDAVANERKRRRGAPSPPSNRDDDVTTRDGNDFDALHEEHCVNDRVWTLIEKFLNCRYDYRPIEARGSHWSRVEDEARSRLDRLLPSTSCHSVDMDDVDPRPLQSRSSSLTTPRGGTVKLSCSSVKRRGSATTNLSLTPLSSNVKSERSSSRSRNDDAEIDDVSGVISSWNFIYRMVRDRSMACARSRESHRSQSFLVEIRTEAEMRCRILKTILLNLSAGKQCTNIEGEGGDGSTATMPSHPSGKRRKLDTDVNRSYSMAPPSLFGHSHPTTLLYAESSAMTDAVHDRDEDYRTDATMMKFHLWSSLLTSLKEIIDG
jgi:hypothetical protein